MSDVDWVGLGEPMLRTEISQSKLGKLFAQELGEAIAEKKHYWVAVVGYRVSLPRTEDYILDLETMRLPPSVGCWLCEQVWSEEANGGPCVPVNMENGT